MSSKGELYLIHSSEQEGSFSHSDSQGTRRGAGRRPVGATSLNAHPSDRYLGDQPVRDPLRGRRKVQLGIAVLLNLVLVVIEVFANLALWRQHPVFRDLVIWYTHQSNFLALLSSALFILVGMVALFRDGRMPRALKVFRLLCTVQLYITFIVVLVGLAPMSVLSGGSFTAMYAGPMFTMHLMAPLLSLLSFVFFEGSPRLTMGDALIGISYTWVYSLVMVVLNAEGILDGPYPFLQVDTNPWWMTLLYFLVMIPGGFLVSACGKWLNNGVACRIAGERKA